MKVRIVDPHVLRELELADETRAPDEGRNAPLPRPSSGAPSGNGGPYVPPRRIIRRRFMLCAVSRGFIRPNVRAERDRVAVRVHSPCS